VEFFKKIFYKAGTKQSELICLVPEQGVWVSGGSEVGVKDHGKAEERCAGNRVLAVVVGQGADGADWCGEGHGQGAWAHR